MRRFETLITSVKANLHVAIIERAAVSDRQRLSAIQSPCSKSLGALYFK